MRGCHLNNLGLGLVFAFLVALLGACASKPLEPPYPAFLQVDDMPDVFIAGLPGVRAKQLAGNPQTRRTSNRIVLPADWEFTTGAAPGLSVEIYVLAGAMTIGGFELSAGGYAYVPPGSTGMQMATKNGAIILYFLDDANEQAVIQTPLVTNSALLEWKSKSENVEDIGLSIKELRVDPGSGARTWLLQIDPIATQNFRSSMTTTEGYLVSGSYQTSECVLGEILTNAYTPGGYFHRPPGAVHGGPEEKAIESAVWYMRTLESNTETSVGDCEAPPSPAG